MEAEPPAHRNGTVPVMTAQSNMSALQTRPTVADLQGDNHYAAIARKTWLDKKKPPKVNPKVLKEEIWDHLETDGFAYGDLLMLETLQALEKYVYLLK
jgi:intron-binding protein aquarius